MIGPSLNLNMQKSCHSKKKKGAEIPDVLKRKRCGTIKAQGCANGHKQRETMSKDEASAPTEAIKSVMLSCVINTKEQQDVTTL